MKSCFLAFFAVVGLTSTLAAQEAVTVSGHVSSGTTPLQGASVRIVSLDVGGTTDADGRYSFIVPSSRVRGQRATITARHARFTTQTVDVTLTGGSLVRDFNLPPVGAGQSSRAESVSAPASAAAPGGPRTALSTIFGRSIVDSSAFAEAPGPLDLPSALAGRVAGVDVVSAAALGGSSPITIRGRKSLIGGTEPLFVVDGTPIDNSTITTVAQRFGFGGFDYGSAAQGLNLGDIATVEVLEGPAAALRYGARGANGVIVVTTKSGAGLNSIDISASQQITAESPIRLPSYQNTYGQGLGGKFAFFNGAGGGLNDAVAESWGPAIQGQPIAQASLTEAKRAEVRPWVGHSDNVSGYFDSGRTFTTNVAAQGSNDRGSFRLSANNRSFTGVTPGSSLTRRGVGLTAAAHPTAAFSIDGNVQYASDEADHRPGSGFDESNPVSAFAVLPRQVDVAALMSHLADSKADPISWNYAGHNNPYYEPLRNFNSDDQSRVMGGVGLTYAFTSAVSATARAGGDSYDANRGFSVARMWMGGYPFFTGRGSFPEGGRESEKISVSDKNFEGAIHFTPGGASSHVSLSVGGNWRGTSLSIIDTVFGDTATGIVGAPKVIAPSRVTTDAHMHGIFATGEFRAEDYAVVTASLRNETSDVFPSGSQLYPAVVGVLDLKQAMSSLRDSRSINGARLRAGFSRAGNDLSPYTLLGLYSGTQTADNTTLSPAAKINVGTSLEPEVTNSFEVGANVQMLSSRFDVDVALYTENTNNLIIATASQGVATPANAGSVTNKGVELTVGATPISSPRLRWDVGATFGKNSSSIGSLPGGVQTLALAPTRWGAGLEARVGQPLPVIVGNEFLRDRNGQLLLSKGLPLPDTISGRKVLGSSAPSWTGGLNSSVHIGWFDVSALLTGRMGGHIFSASNLWGATSGNLSETAFRPDSGLLIAGIDAATNAANKVHVTTEDYYHALRAIPERWVYDASVVKLREARVSASLPLRIVPGFRSQSVRVALVGRNLFMWAKAPNIDPETAVSTWGIEGFELGQLPTTRSVGFQITITP